MDQNKTIIPQRRCLFVILPLMIQLIPDDDIEFKTELNEQLDKASFTAPENIFNIWINVQDIITKRFKYCKNSNTLPKWCIDLLDIWTNKNQSGISSMS